MWHTQVVCIDKSNQLCSTVHCNDARSAHNIILSLSRMSHSQAILLLTANNNADLLHLALTLYVHSTILSDLFLDPTIQEYASTGNIQSPCSDGCLCSGFEDLA